MKVNRVVLSIFFFAALTSALYTSILNKPFWLDECISAWFTSGSLQELFAKLNKYPSQSGFYCTLLWIWRSVAGSSEFTARVPSLFFIALAAVGVFKLSRRYAEIPSALTGTAAFLSCTFVIHSLSARPYALGLASAVWSTLWLFEAATLPGLSIYWLLSGAALISAIYAHYLFGGIVVVQVAFALAKPGALKRFIAMLLCVGAACLPLASTLIRLAKMGHGLSFAQPLTFGALLSIAAHIPLQVGAALLLGVAEVLVLLSKRRTIKVFPRAEGLALLVWMIAPWIIFAAISSTLGMAIVLPRYLLWTFPSYSIFAAGALQAVPRQKVRLVLCWVALIACTVINLRRSWDWEDWKGAAAMIAKERQPSDPVLVYTGLVELGSETLVSDKSNWPYLLVPFEEYPVSEPLLPLPNAEDKSPTFTNVVMPQLKAVHHFIFAGAIWNPESKDNAVARLIALTSPEGFVAKPVRLEGPVWIVRFDRASN